MSVPLASSLFAMVVFCTYSSAITVDAQTLSPPTGTFAVGRVTLHWVDESRPEPLSDDKRHRELIGDIWYPAEGTKGEAAEYLGHFSAYEEAPEGVAITCCWIQ